MVGGGVIGTAVAEHLARVGHPVTLLERDQLGSKASGGAAGLLAPHSESAHPPAFTDLARRSHSLFPELANRLAKDTLVDVEFRALESLRLATSDLELALLDQHQSGFGQAHRLDASQCRELEPGLGSDVCAGLLFQESQVSPLRLVTALARSAIEHGAEIREGTPVEAPVASGGVVTGVRTPAGVLNADWVVLAAGPWTGLLASALGLAVDVAPRRGQLVTLAPRRRELSRILTAGTSYAVPKPDGTVVLGSTEEEAGFDARPTVAGVARILGLATAWLPALANATVQAAWAGLRPVTSTGMPIIGPDPDYPNLIVATGHHRNGILLAPITAEIVARGLGGGWA